MGAIAQLCRAMSPGTQVTRRQIGGDDMATRRGTLVGFPFIERVGNLFDTLQIHYHIDEDRAARGDSYVPLSDFLRSTLSCRSLTVD